jgi:chaperonin GroEL (HSP60 family)
LDSFQRDLERIQVIKRASRTHEYFAAVDSTGEYKRTPVTTRSISAEELDKLDAFKAEPAQVVVTLCIGGKQENELTVSEYRSIEELRKIVSNYFERRCRVQRDEFPAKDGTEV